MVRESERIALDEPARLHPNEWSSLEVRVLDCSETGFRAFCEAVVKVGSMVTLEVPGVGPARAQVSWRRGTQFGAKFAEPVALAKATFVPVNEEAVLARMLVQRAAARGSGLFDQELQLRQRILAALPVRKITDPSPPESLS